MSNQIIAVTVAYASITVRGRLRQGFLYEFKAGLVYIMRLRSSKAT